MSFPFRQRPIYTPNPVLNSRISSIHSSSTVESHFESLQHDPTSTSNFFPFSLSSVDLCFYSSSLFSHYAQDSSPTGDIGCSDSPSESETAEFPEESSSANSHFSSPSTSTSPAQKSFNFLHALSVEALNESDIADVENDEAYFQAQFELQEDFDMGSALACCQETSPKHCNSPNTIIMDDIQDQNNENTAESENSMFEITNSDDEALVSAKDNTDEEEEVIVEKIVQRKRNNEVQSLKDEQLFGPYAYTLASQEHELDEENSHDYEFNCATTKLEAWDSRAGSSTLRTLDTVYQRYAKLELGLLSYSDRLQFITRKWKGEHY